MLELLNIWKIWIFFTILLNFLPLSTDVLSNSYPLMESISSIDWLISSETYPVNMDYF